MKIRKLTEPDYEVLVKWWKAYNFKSPPTKDILPENGKGGLIIEKNNKPIAACFIYDTNANVSWMAWPISDPQYRQEDRDLLIETLLIAAEQISISMGNKLMMSIGRSKSMVNKHKKLGWSIDHNPAYEMIKLI